MSVRAKLSVPCPQCGAAIGEGCRSRSGRLHSQRVARVRRRHRAQVASIGLGRSGPMVVRHAADLSPAERARYAL